jgi:hypothetical protein
MIWALLEKSPSSSSAFLAGCSSAFPLSGAAVASEDVCCEGIGILLLATPASSVLDFGAADEATSFRTSVFAKRTELS